MDYKPKLRRNRIIAVCSIFSILIIFGALIGFENLGRLILFMVPGLIGLPLGVYYFTTHFDRKRLRYLLHAWIGFVFSATSFVGMLIDPRGRPINWPYLFVVAGIVWLTVTLVTFLFTPLFMGLSRFIRPKK